MLGFAPQSWRDQSLGVLLSWLGMCPGVGALSRVWGAGLCWRWGLPGALRGWSSGGTRMEGAGAGCGALLQLRMWDASGVAVGSEESAWSPGHFSDSGVGLDGSMQSWPNIRVPTQPFHIPLAPLARLPASSSLQEVAAHQELSEHGALHLSTCLQSLLQEEMPGKGNEAMEKLAELPFAGTVPWLRDQLGC